MKKDVKKNSKKIINQKEIRFLGLSRSGNHAVIDWILSQCKGRSFFLDSIKIYDTNPYLGLGYFTTDILRECANLSVKDCLVYSYENIELKNLFSENFEKKHDEYLGRTLKRFDVLLLRDAFNFFASSIVGAYADHIPWRKKHTYNSLRDQAENNKRLWKMYAREYLGETNYLQHNKVVISYNQWFASKKYRQELAKKLSLKFSDKSLDTVSMVSTFDKNMVRGKPGAKKLKVLERWKELVSSQLYRDIFADQELVDLSNKIFGKIPGTEVLFSKKTTIAKKNKPRRN
jgi:hypothetical protein